MDRSTLHGSITVWLSLGSNIGDREKHISNAVAALQDILKNPIQAPLYVTAPCDFTDQPDFINTVIRGETELSPPGLMEHIMEIEIQGGRQRTGIPAKGPRTIDIDILLWDNLVAKWSFKGHNLIIPHPAMHLRRFVLEPLINIDPSIADPIDGILFQSKKDKLTGQMIKLYNNA